MKTRSLFHLAVFLCWIGLIGCDETLQEPELSTQKPPGQYSSSNQSQPTTTTASGTRESPQSTYGKAYGAAKAIVNRAEQQSADLAEQFDESTSERETDE